MTRHILGPGLLVALLWLVLVVVCVLPVPPARDAQPPEPRPSPTVYQFYPERKP